MTAVKILGIPVQTVIGKAAYLAGVLVAWAITATIVGTELGPILFRALGGSASFYAVVAAAAQLFVAVFFLVWLRSVYK